MNGAPVRVEAVTAPKASSTSGMLIRRQCACGTKAGPSGGQCSQCRQRRRVQARLGVGSAHDPLEQEADRVAAQVLADRPESVGTEADSVPRIHRTPAASASGGESGMEAPISVERVLADAGAPLEPALRKDMESRFGHDFSRVRVHHGAAASASANDISARAYTFGAHVVFAAGAYAPTTPAGRHLLAHELTHVVQQDAGEGALVQRDLCYGSGYSSPYAGARGGGDAREIRDLQSSHWHPSSVDMKKVAEDSGGGTAVATFEELLDLIEAKPAGSISRLGVIGHANHEHFALGGRIDNGAANNVFFNQPAALINVETVAKKLPRIETLRDRFAKGAELILYGCNAGAGGPLMDALSTAFQVCVLGFTEEIQYCVTFTGNRITSADRGRAWVGNPHDPIPQERPAQCADWPRGVNSLLSDRKSCVGVAPELDYDALIAAFDAATVNDWWGTDEEGTYRVLQALGRNPDHVAEFDLRYQAKHEKDDLKTVRSVLDDELSGSELQYALQLINTGNAGSEQAIGTVPEKDEEWDAIAKRLHTAFFGDYGTDEEAVFAVLLPLGNDAELIGKLEAAYAKLDKEMTLEQRIRDEMGSTELSYALELFEKKDKKSS